MTESIELVNSIVEGIQDRKGKRISVIDLSGTGNSICSHFLVCTGDSSTHVNAIADSIISYVREDVKEKPLAKDGFENAQWVAIDYGDVMVHVFQRETRDFYNIEGLWADGKVTNIEDLD